ncbi:dTDP-4-dehydrorhamnose reductase family protein [Aliikangiella sp. IMCC44632]
MKILIVGATGMLGYSLFTNLSDYSEYNVYGTVRNITGKEQYFKNYSKKLVMGIDVSNLEAVDSWLASEKPDVVINCIGLIKQHDISKQHVDAISVNALLPHLLANLCAKNNARLIHFSTDCVFTGEKGNYTEADIPDAQDLYGKSKHLGEVDYAPHLTLRTSIIGHELNSSVSLVDWFLSQTKSVSGYSKAVFSGLPTCFVAKVLAENILKNLKLTGLYHLSVNPINKYDLLTLVAKIYNKSIEINKSDKLVIDRSLNSTRLKADASLSVPSWEQLIVDMKNDFERRYK